MGLLLCPPPSPLKTRKWPSNNAVGQALLPRTLPTQQGWPSAHWCILQSGLQISEGKKPVGVLIKKHYITESACALGAAGMAGSPLVLPCPVETQIFPTGRNGHSPNSDRSRGHGDKASLPPHPSPVRCSRKVMVSAAAEGI